MSTTPVTDTRVTVSDRPWAAGVAYTVGQQVTYQGHTYQCAQAHTSQTGWEPTAAPALWTQIA